MADGGEEHTARSHNLDVDIIILNMPAIMACLSVDQHDTMPQSCQFQQHQWTACSPATLQGDLHVISQSARESSNETIPAHTLHIAKVANCHLVAPQADQAVPSKCKHHPWGTCQDIQLLMALWNFCSSSDLQGELLALERAADSCKLGASELTFIQKLPTGVQWLCGSSFTSGFQLSATCNSCKLVWLGSMAT